LGSQPDNDENIRLADLVIVSTKPKTGSIKILMARNEIRKKFGGDYIANEHTFILGSDHQFASHFAKRFVGMQVLETCTGAGFTTIPLARRAKHVYTVEINQKCIPYSCPIH